MKKALFFSVLSFLLCSNLAFATAEATSGIIFKGTIATIKQGFLPATITMQSKDNTYINDGQEYLFSGVITIKADSDGKTFYDKTFACTGYGTETFLIVTTQGTAILSGKLSESEVSMLLQIPADGITGLFQVVTTP